MTVARRLRGRAPESGPLTSFELTSLSSFGLLYKDAFLPVPDASRVRAESLKLARSGAMALAGVGRGQAHRLAPTLRGDQIAWVEERRCGPGMAPLLCQLDRLRRQLNRELFMGLQGQEIQCSYHQPGSPGYGRHKDTFRDRGRTRVLTVLFYLNPGWQHGHGGALEVFLPSGTVTVEPRHNRLLVFMSELEHQVLPVEAPRLALTAWFH